MFRKNERHRQQSFLTGVEWMPEKLRKGISDSWAGAFREQVFCRIDEELFVDLYSEEISRPNTPVNVLVSAEILKSGFGWSDEEVHEEVCYNLLVRHALGLADLRAEIFTLRTLYNFRRRVREYAETSGVNLMQRVFEQVTDRQLEALALRTGWQRMDSTQVLSNLAQWSRMELLVGVLQTAYRQLPEAEQVSWQERLGAYLRGRPHQVCHRIPAKEQTQHMEKLGMLMSEMATELAAIDPAHDGLSLLRRVLEEQFVQSPAGAPTLRPAKEVSAESLQSPHDPDATYRVKGGKAYRGGYVVNASETADPENPVQLITAVQVEPNHTDDAQLLKQSLEEQTQREIAVERVTTDGGYTGPTGEQACADHGVELRATRMRGGKSAADHWGWECYTWEMAEDGTPVRVTCPQGVTAEVRPGRSPQRFVVHFAGASCAACPFYQSQCRVRPRCRTGPGFSIARRAIEVACQRQRLRPEDAGVRAVVEATIREIKHPFRGGKLPVRGLIRARMVIYGSALMANLRRIHRQFTVKRDISQPQTPVSNPSLPFVRLRTSFAGLQRLWVSVGLGTAHRSMAAC